MLEPKVVYLMAGINDVGKKPIDEFESQYSFLVNSLVKNLPCVSLLIQSILPVNNKDFKVSCDNNQIKSCNDRIKRIAEVFGLSFLDLYSLYEDEGQLPLMYTKDGIHLIPRAYDRWYHEIC